MSTSNLVPAIVCEKLVKTFPGPVQAVNQLDLVVHQGECFGLLGPNGAGKTTTIEILEGLQEQTAGKAEVLGLSWKKDAKRLRQKIGVALQETHFMPKLKVFETIRLFRSFFKEGPSPQKLMERLDLLEKAQSYVSTLSGGQKQRLALACALAGDPDLVFLDEPTTGLDPQARRALWQLIEGLKQEGKTVLLTTHYMEEAERLCDRIAIVDHGKVIALGSTQELMATWKGNNLEDVFVHLTGRSLKDDE